jgi:hypothetical protein
MFLSQLIADNIKNSYTNFLKYFWFKAEIAIMLSHFNWVSPGLVSYQPLLGVHFFLCFSSQ